MSWLHVLAAIVAIAAIAVAAGVLAVWHDPHRLLLAEFARERIAAGFALRQATIDGCRWCYVERAAPSSQAPTLVLLHGYTGGKENWYRVCAKLGRRYRLVAPDLPGWGGSERRAGVNYGYVAQADNVAAFLRHLGAAPVVLVGHSMGGGIAALVAARHPPLVAKLALLDAAGVEFEENAFGLEVLAGGNPFAVADAASLSRYLGVLFHDASARPPLPWPGSWAYVAWRRREADFEQSVLARIGRSDERFLPWQDAERIHQPTLLLWGAHDRVIDPSAMALYAQRIPQARTRLLLHSGHMTLMEEPGAVAEALIELVEETPA